MQENQDKLKGKENIMFLDTKKTIPRDENIRGYAYSSRRKKRTVLKKWYTIYLITTASIVLAVLMLLLFGVGADSRPIISGLVTLKDKIAGCFIDIDFFDLSLRKDSADGIQTDDLLAPTPPFSADSSENTDKNYSPDADVDITVTDIYDFDYSKVPDGHTPIIPMDLSLSSLGSSYINNSTGYTPNVLQLLNKNLKDGNGYKYLSVSSSPLVLIVHTHGTEAYSDDGATSYSDDESDYARSGDTDKNVVAVGKTIADILNKNGIPTAHCTIMHDSVQYKDSYIRAEETIKKYLEEYPTIKLVIDVHRDSIVKSSGEMVRPVAELDGEAAAQIMCVVGSDWEGDGYPDWENNLSLALKLREKLNSEQYNICRPVNLKGHTYNQELSAFSLLLEVGAAGNSLVEAQRSAKLIGEKLCELLKEI